MTQDRMIHEVRKLKQRRTQLGMILIVLCVGLFFVH
jgi:hypothetical protein